MFEMKYLLCFIGALLLTWDNYTTPLELEENRMYILGLFDIHNENGDCYPPDEETITTMMAVRWYIDQVGGMLGLPYDLTYEDYWACNADTDTNDELKQFAEQVKVNKNVIGIISSLENRWTTRLASIFGVSDITRLAISSTAEEFADRGKYPYFYRVIPGDSKQLKTMVLLIEKLGWKNIAIIHENSTCEQQNALDLLQAVHDKGIAATIDTTQSENAEKRWQDCYNIFRGFLSTKSIPDVVVFFGHHPVASTMFRVLNRSEFNDLYLKAFMFSATVGLDGDVFWQQTFSGRAKALIFSPPYTKIESFADYWKSLFTNMTWFESAMESLPLMKYVFKYHAPKSCDPSVDFCFAFTPAYASEVFHFQPLSVQYGIIAAHVMVKLIKDIYVRLCPKNLYCKLISKFRPIMVQEMKNLTADFAKDFNVQVLPLSSSGFRLTYSNLQEPIASSTDEVYQVYIFRDDADTSSRTPSRIKVGGLSYSEELSLDISALKAYGFEINSAKESNDSNEIKTGNGEEKKNNGDASEDSKLFINIGILIGLALLGLSCAVAVFVCKKRKKVLTDETYMYITPTADTPTASVSSNDRISILPCGSRNLEMYAVDHYDNIGGPLAEDPDNQLQTETSDGFREQFHVSSGAPTSQQSHQMKHDNGVKSTPHIRKCTPRLHDSL